VTAQACARCGEAEAGDQERLPLIACIALSRAAGEWNEYEAIYRIYEIELPALPPYASAPARLVLSGGRAIPDSIASDAWRQSF
jgi:hypothetical protein